MAGRKGSVVFLDLNNNSNTKGQTALSSDLGKNKKQAQQTVARDYKNPYESELLNQKYQDTVRLLGNLQKKTGAKTNVIDDALALMDGYKKTVQASYALNKGIAGKDYLRIGDNEFQRQLEQTIYKYQYGSMDAAGLEKELARKGYQTNGQQKALTEQNVIGRAKEMGAGMTPEERRRANYLDALADATNALPWTDGQNGNVKNNQSMALLGMGGETNQTTPQANAGQAYREMAQEMRSKDNITLADAEKYLSGQGWEYGFAKEHPGDLSGYAAAFSRAGDIVNRAMINGVDKLTDTEKEVYYALQGNNGPELGAGLLGMGGMTNQELQGYTEWGRQQAAALQGVNGLYINQQPDRETQFILNQYRQTPEGAKQWAQDAIGTPEEQEAKQNEWFVTRRAKFDEVPTVGNYAEDSQPQADFSSGDATLDRYYRIINNIGGERDSADLYQAMSGGNDPALTFFYNTDETDQGKFTALMNRGQFDEARDYLDYMQYAVNEKTRERTETAMYNLANNGALGAIAASALSVPLSLTRGVGALDIGLQNLRNQFGEYRPVDYNRMQAMGAGADAARQGVQDQVNWGMNVLGQDVDLFDFLYGTAMSGVDSMAAGALGSWAGPAVLGLGAAQNTMMDLQQQGGNDRQVMIGGALAGAFETLFEHISIGQFYDEAKHLGKRNFGEHMKNILAQAGINFSEEFNTELFDMIAEESVMGSKAQTARQRQEYLDLGLTEEEANARIAQEKALRLLEAGFGGALMGGAFGGISNVTSDVSTSRFETKAGKVFDAESKGTLKSLGSSLPDGEAKAMARKYDPEKATDRETGALVRAIMQALPQQAQGSFKETFVLGLLNSLEDMSPDAAGAIADMMSGQQLAPEQIDALAKDQAGMQAVYALLGVNGETGRAMQKRKTEQAEAGPGTVEFEPMPGMESGDNVRSNEQNQEGEKAETAYKPREKRLPVMVLEENSAQNAGADAESPEARETRTAPSLEEQAGNDRQIVDAGEGTKGEGKAVMGFQVDEESGAVTAEMEDGSRQDVEELPISDAQKEIAQETAGMDAEAQGTVMQNYDGKRPAKQYAQGMKNVYQAARKGQSLEEIRSLYGEDLNDPQRKAAWEAGRAAYEREEQQALDDTRRNQDKAKADGYNFKVLEQEDAEQQHKGVYLARVRKAMTRNQEIQLAVLEDVLNKKDIPVQIRVYDTMNDKNGSYVSGTNIINVALDAEGGLINRSVSHELFHFVKRFDPEAAATIQKFVIDILSKTKGYDLEKRRERVGQRYRDEADQTLTGDGIDEEIAAESMLDAIDTQENLQAFYKNADKSLIEKITDWIKDTVAKIRDAMARIGRNHPEVEAMRGNLAALEKIQNDLIQAAQTAGQNYLAARAGLNSQAAQDADVMAYQEEMGRAVTPELAQEARNGLESKLFARYYADMGGDLGGLEYEDAFQRFQAAMEVFGSGESKSLAWAFNQAKIPVPKQGMNSVLSYAARQMAEGKNTKSEFKEKIDKSAETLEKNKYTVANMDAVDKLNGDEVNMNTGDINQQVRTIYEKQGGTAYSQELGDVDLMPGIETSRGHGMGQNKAAAYAAVKPVIENGRMVAYTENYAGKGYDRALIAAPIKIGPKDFYMGVLLNRYKDNQRFYLHEVWLTDGSMATKNKQQAHHSLVSERKSDLNQASPTAYMNSILDSLKNYKGKEQKFSLKADAEYLAAAERGDEEEAQRMVDEAAKAAGYNTPKLYHGTRSFGFTEFDLGLGENLIFATSDRRIAETYSSETPRSRINQRTQINVNDLRGEELLHEAQKHIPKKYDGYELMTNEEKKKVADEARGDIRQIVQNYKGFINDHEGAFNDEKMEVMNKLLQALTDLSEAQTDDELWEAWDAWDTTSWDFKFMDESLFDEFLDDFNTKQLYYAKNKLSDFLYNGDMYQKDDRFSFEYIFDNKLALELDAELHKGVYELFGREGKQLVIDAEGGNWNSIVPPDELHLYGPQKTRDIAAAAEANGYNSVLIKNLKDSGGETAYNWPSDIYIFFDANQVKSADPITYDDEGNVIPLSERFNEGTPDIRYSFKADEEADTEAQALEDVRADADLYSQMQQDEDARAALLMLRQLHALTTQGGADALIKPGAFEKRLSEIVSKIEEETGTKYGHNKLMAALRKVYKAMEQRDYNLGEILQYTRGIMQEVLEKAPGVLVEQDETTREVIRILKTRPIYLSEQQKSEIAGTYGALGDYMRKNFGKMRIRKQSPTTASLEDVWREDFAPLLPGTFAEDTSPLDMPGIVDAWLENANAKKFAGEFGANIGAYATNQALNAMLDFYDVPGALKTKEEIRQGFQERFNEQRAKINQLTETARGAVDQARLQYEERYRNRIEKDQARKEETERKQKLRGQITRDVKAINTLNVNMTDTRHVPESMRAATLAAVEPFISNSGVFSGAAQIRLAHEYEMLKQRIGEIGGFDEDILESINGLGERLNGRRLSQLTEQELQDLADITGNLRKIIADTNEAFVNGRKTTIDALSARLKQDMRNRGPARQGRPAEMARALSYRETTPTYFADRVGGVIRDMIKDLYAGQNTWAFAMNQAKAFLGEDGRKKSGVMGKYHVNDWINDKKHARFTTQHGDMIELNRQEALSLYALWKRETSNKLQNANHLRVGGFMYDKGTRYEGVDTLRPHPLTESDMKMIRDYLTEEQKAFADEMVGYLSKDMAKIGNETSMRLYGYEKFKEGYYFPYDTDHRYLVGDLTQNGEQVKQPKSAGMTKALMKNAATPITVKPFTEVWASHVNQMGLYAGFAEAIDTMSRVFNQRESGQLIEANGEEYVITPESNWIEMEKALGAEGVKYIKTLARDVSGGVRADERSIVGKGLSLFKKGSVAGNLSVALQQPTAYARAMMMVNPQYLLSSNPTKLAQNIKNMYKYSGVALIKKMGRFDTGTGKGAIAWMQDAIKGDNPGQKALEFTDKWTGMGAEKADEWTWGILWGAIERETQHTRPDLNAGTEEFYQAVAERFEDVVNHTQVYDSVLSKSEWMRSNTTMDKMVTSFMAEPTLTLNMLQDAIVNFRQNGGGKKVARAAATFLVNSALVALAKSIVTATRRKDDEGRTWLEKYLAEAAGNFAEDVSPYGLIGMIPWARDAVSLLEGYSVERSDMDAMEQLVNAWKIVTNENKSVEEKIQAASGAVGNIFGIPVKNLWRNTEAILRNLFGGAGASEPTTGRDVLYSVMDKTGLAVPFTGNGFGAWDSSRAAYYDRMEEALKAGDMDRYNELRGYVEDTLQVKSDTVDSGIKKEIRGSLTAGLISDDRAIELLEALGMDSKKAFDTAYKWSQTAGHEDEEDFEYNKYGQIQSMIAAGQDISAEVKRFTDHGTSEKTMESAVKGAIKDLYTAGTLTDSQTESSIKKYLGITDKEEIHWLMDEWAYKRDNGAEASYSKYVDVYDAVRNGTSLTAAMKEMTQNGYTEKDVRAQIKSKVAEWYKKGELTKAQAEQKLRQYAGITDSNDLYWAMDQLDYEKSNPKGEYRKYNEFYRAVETGSGLQSTVKKYMDHGVKAETMASQITSQYKAQYVELYRTNKTKAAELKARLLTAYAALGYDRSKKQKDIDKWVK